MQPCALLLIGVVAVEDFVDGDEVDHRALREIRGLIERQSSPADPGHEHVHPAIVPAVVGRDEVTVTRSFDRADALRLLTELGAPARLLRHAELVGEASDALLSLLAGEGVTFEEGFVRAGVALHDAGKCAHPAELDGPGSLHEDEGERMLLARGVAPSLARVCRSHSRWASMECSLEELVIALSDKLWKGVRVAALEEAVIDAAATRAGRDRWELFVALSDGFERVASEGDARLARSVG